MYKTLSPGFQLVLAGALISLMIGCAALEGLTDSESVLIVKVATAEAIYKNDAPGSVEVCNRAFRGNEIVNEARKVVDNGVLSLVSIEEELAKVIYGAGLNPTTSVILLDVAANVVREYTAQLDAGAAVPGANVTLNHLLDAIEDVSLRAAIGCA